MTSPRAGSLTAAPCVRNRPRPLPPNTDLPGPFFPRGVTRPAGLVVSGPAPAGQEVKLMAVAAGAMAGTGVARVDPERDTVGDARSGDVALGRLRFAADLDLHPDAQLVPGQADVSEIVPAVHR